MSNEKVTVAPGLINSNDLCKLKEAVCIQTEKIYDSCREKDCIENARVRFNNLSEAEVAAILDAFNVKIRRAVVDDVITDIEPVPFKRGFYTVDVKFIITVTLDFFTRLPNGTVVPTEVTGTVTFDKRVILFGSEGNVKIFKSRFVENGMDIPVNAQLQQDNMPFSKVEVAEPIPLSARIRDITDKQFGEPFEMCHDDDDDSDMHSRQVDQLATRRVYVTLGLFSIIKLVRFVQLLIPVFDFCIPAKECIAATEENPCELFETIPFPVEAFAPRQIPDFPGAVEEIEAMMHEQEEHHKHHNNHNHNNNNNH